MLGVGLGVGIRQYGSGFRPANLFRRSEQGAWYDPSDLSTLFQDSAGTTPVTAAGQPVGLMLDKSGRGNHATQATAAARPTYQTSGGLHWLAFDGVDDFMATPTIDFTATNKLSAFVAVEMVSSAAIGAVLQSGGASAAAKRFALFAPRTAGASGDYGIRVFDAAAGAIDVATSAFPVPDKAVLSGKWDNAAAAGLQISLRRNAVDLAQAGSTMTGNFISEPVYIGNRGIDLPFNGKIYGLVLRGAATSAGEITQAEKYMAGKSGVTL